MAGVALLGNALTRLPIDDLRIVVGALLLIYGVQWLRKAILRAAGLKALHDEAGIYEHEREVALAAEPAPGSWDGYSFAGGLQRGADRGPGGRIIVVTFGASQHRVGLAAVAAAIAVALVIAAGFVVQAPLAKVPENTMKFAVGVMLCSFGIFWGLEGLGVSWPGGDAVLLAIVPVTLAASLLAVHALRRSPRGDRRGAAAVAPQHAPARPYLRTLDAVIALLASASVGQSLSSFFDAAGQFFSDLAAVHWPALLLGLLFFGLNLTLRSRAFFNSLRAAYPAVPSSGGASGAPTWRRSASTTSCPRAEATSSSCSSRAPRSRARAIPTVAAAFFVESIFDVAVGVLVLLFAFTQGVFPKPPDFSKLSSFDISYLAEHFRLTLFLITALGSARPGRLRAAVGARAGLLGARAPGRDDPQRPAAATCARSPRCRRSRGRAASPPSGSCSTPSAWAAR